METFRWGKANGWAQSAHPDWDRVNLSENLGKAAALPALPLITPLALYVFQGYYINKKCENLDNKLSK